MAHRKIYLASSWRNPLQPQALELLRNAGHEVYDFRNPSSHICGFSWQAIALNWQYWTPEQFIDALKDPLARTGFKLDKAALDWCDTCVLLLPCGKSAHLEAGYAIGQGKPTLIVLHPSGFEAELMYLLAGSPACIVSGLEHMLGGLERICNADEGSHAQN